MRHISVGLVIRVEDDIAADHEELIAYLESHIFGEDGLTGSILTTADITERVETRIEEMRRRSRGERP
ncbi:MAG: hypothetical protein PHI67_11680 [Candidatus Methanomethylophilaceae archaeon]|nr:hypothetical protein [Candidatus Methanomethylophilaceae archaeon]